MLRRRRLPLVLAALLVLVGPLAMAGADPAPGGQAGIDASSTRRADAMGPSAFGLAWQQALPDYNTPGRGRDLVLDAEGHVLVQLYRDGDAQTLVALEAATGQVAWETTGIAVECAVVATDDGRVIAQGAEGGGGQYPLVVVDAADGSVLAGQGATGEGRCTDLRLVDDTLVVESDAGRVVTGFELDDSGLTRAWDADFPSSRGGAIAPVALLPAVAVRATSPPVVHLWQDDDDPADAWKPSVVDLDDGTVLDTATLPGVVARSGVTSVPGFEVVVAQSACSGGERGCLTRASVDGARQLTLETVVDGPDDAPFTSLALGDGVVMGWAGSDVSIASLDTLERTAEVDTTSFQNNESRIVADADGNGYVSTFGGAFLETFTSAGTVLGRLDSCALDTSNLLAIGPVDGDGRLFALARETVDGTQEPTLLAFAGDAAVPRGTCEVGGQRFAGAGRFETGIDVARASYPQDGSASAVVLARGDDFADALAGTPLAVARDAPMLITASDELLAPVADEIQRLLGSTDRTVWLLGGTAALSGGVEQAVRDLGYGVERLDGPDRYATAVAIAEELGDPGTVFVGVGTSFADALAAGPAAAAEGGAVLLTVPEGRAPATDAYLAAHGRDVYAVGGPAARPYPEATALSGPDRHATAAVVAERFFDAPPAVGLARSDDFPDALTGGAHVAALTQVAGAGGPMLITPSTTLVGPVASYLCGPGQAASQLFVYGGSGALSDQVQADARQRLGGSGC